MMMLQTNLKDVLDSLKKERMKVYHVLEIPLDSAVLNEEYPIVGSYLFVLDFDGSDFDIRLNETSSDLIALVKARQINSPFYRLLITHTAQAGKKIKLAIGVNTEYFSMSDFQAPDLSSMAANIASMKADIESLHDTLAYSGLYGYFGKDYGTQIVKSGSVNNGTTIIHTVTAGKTLLLEGFVFNIDSGVAIGAMFVTDGADLTQYNLGQIGSQTTVGVSLGIPVKLKIQEGWKIKLSINAIHTAMGTIFGREY